MPTQTILVIDDDENLRDTIGVLLEREGFGAILAADGKTGDGCGVSLKRPEKFLRAVAAQSGIGLAARFAAEHASPMEIHMLQELVAQQGGAKDAAMAAHTNDLLREAITSAAHNEFLTRATNSLNDALELLGATTYSMPGRIESGWKENKKVVEAIARRNGSVAEDAARLHVRNAAKLRVQMLFGKRAG